MKKTKKEAKKKLIGWKKAHARDARGYSFDVLVKLEILGKVVRPNERIIVGNYWGVPKYRTDKAKVLSVQLTPSALARASGTKASDLQRWNGRLIGFARDDYRYYRGKVCRPDWFDPHPKNLCSNGIHFFKLKKYALAW